MEIKFNCSNPACNQRMVVDEALAGRALPCPACATILWVPLRENSSVGEQASPSPSPGEIKFNCSNPDCLQPITVNSLQAGQRLKCPKCGRIIHVPGTRVESVTEVVLVEALPAESETIVSVVEVTSNAMDDEAGTRFWNLLKGPQASVLGERFEHVVEECDVGLHLDRAAVEVECQIDGRLARRAHDRRAPPFAHPRPP